MIISPPGNDSFWENLRSTADVFFIFFSFQSWDLKDASANRRKILHGGQYKAKFYNAGPKFRSLPQKILGTKSMQNFELLYAVCVHQFKFFSPSLLTFASWYFDFPWSADFSPTSPDHKNHRRKKEEA